MDYLPPGWLVQYYKTTNGFLYMSDEGKLFNSAKRVMDFMRKMKFDQEIISGVRSNMKAAKKFTSKLKYKWLPGDETLPEGWKRRKARGTGYVNKKEWVEYILSAEGVQFKSLFEALHFMLTNGCSREEVEEVKLKLLQSDEKWKEHELLPKDWIWKWKGEGVGKEKNPSCNQVLITYMSREGNVFYSMKSVMDAMKTSTIYSEEDLKRCKEFVKEMAKPDVRHTWVDGGDCLPPGWKSRTSEGEAKWLWILSPEGRSYRTRFVAIQDMKKRGASSEELQVMKEKMVQYEGWQLSNSLPQGWLVKVIWEGVSRNGNHSQNIHYLSPECQPFESMKQATDFMKNCKGYSEEDFKKCQEFLKLRSNPSQKYTWIDGGDSLPPGWKTRTSKGEAKMEWILSPEGQSYRTRFVAIQDMKKQGASHEELKQMKKKMIQYEGWQVSDSLPRGWQFKVVWEGVLGNGRKSQTIHYLSRECQPFESIKQVKDFMISCDDYSEEDLRKCNEFLRLQNKPDEIYTWMDGGDSLPPGWKTRTSEGEAEWKWILSVDGRSYRSRFIAVQDMVKLGHDQRLVEEMKQKMVEYEGWERSSFLPPNWLYKVIFHQL